MVANFSTRFTAVLLVVAMVGGAMAVGALASSHTPEESTDQATTYLRVVHASANAGAVDVYLDNDSVVTDASFGDVTEYMELEAGTYNLTITEAGDEEAVVFEDNVTLDPRTPTTVAASGEVTTAETADDETAETTEAENGTFAPLVFTDNPLPPGEDDSAIRVVHLSSDAPTVDVTTDNGSVMLAENVSAGNASDYTNVPAGDYTVEIREATSDGNGTVIATANVSLAGGEAYSAWAMGMIESEDAANETAAGNETEEADNETATGNETEAASQAFTVELTQDATVSVHLPSDEETETPGEEETDTPAEEESPTPTATETAGEEETDTPAEEESPTPTVTETPGDEEPTPPTVPEPP